MTERRGIFTADSGGRSDARGWQGWKEWPGHLGIKTLCYRKWSEEAGMLRAGSDRVCEFYTKVSRAICSQCLAKHPWIADQTYDDGSWYGKDPIPRSKGLQLTWSWKACSNTSLRKCTAQAILCCNTTLSKEKDEARADSQRLATLCRNECFLISSFLVSRLIQGSNCDPVRISTLACIYMTTVTWAWCRLVWWSGRLRYAQCVWNVFLFFFINGFVSSSYFIISSSSSSCSILQWCAGKLFRSSYCCGSTQSWSLWEYRPWLGINRNWADFRWPVRAVIEAASMKPFLLSTVV